MILLRMTISTVIAQTPVLTHVFDIRAEISGARNNGKVPYGERIVIPITGGEVTGEVNGKILPGGADYQIADPDNKRTELRAVYTIEAEDSTLINVVNEGIISESSDGYYFMTSPKFECAMDSRYSWLNNRIFVCRPVGFEDGAIVLRIWKVE